MHLLRHFFVPHHTNNHRARILHPTLLAFFIAMLLLIHAIFNLVATFKPGVLGIGGNISTQLLVELTNRKRSEEGVGALSYNQQLSEAAYKKAQDMFNNNYWAHTSPQGRDPWDFITESGYNYYYAGENLAKDFSSESAVIDAWMASPSHRENLLRSQYQDIGMAVVTGTLDGKETVLIVQMFGSHYPSTLATSPQTLTQPTPQPGKLSSELFAEKSTPGNIVALPNEEEVMSIPTTFLSAKKETSRPSIDVFAFTKATTLMLSVILVVVLGLDTLVAYHRNAIRISGNNWVHIAYMLVLASAIWLTSAGVIL